MTGLLFNGSYLSQGLKEDEAQSTVEPIRTDGEGAELHSAPEWNSVESDSSGELIGLSPRPIGSDTHDSEKSAPVAVAMPGVYGTRNELIDRQVASSGTAARREEMGQRGHGTMKYEIGIDPLNPAEKFGNDFFVRDSLSANEGSGDYMSPVPTDNWAQQVAQSHAAAASRQAYMGSLYSSYFAN